MPDLTPDQQKRLANAALELLKRVTLKGDEVPMFVTVNNWLTSMTSPIPEATPAKQETPPPVPPATSDAFDFPTSL